MQNKIKSPETMGWKSRKKLFLAVVALIPLGLCCLYFTLTSSAFITGVVLPQAGKMLDSDIKVQSVHLKPFSSLVVKGLKLTPNNTHSLIQSADAEIDYSLMEILQGTIVVSRIQLKDVEIELHQDADGKTNVDPILEAIEKLTAGKKEQESTEPLNLRIGKVSLDNSTVQIVRAPASGGRETVKLGPLSVSLDQLGNDLSSHLEFSIPASIQSPESDSALTGQINGKAQVRLGQELLPSLLESRIELNIPDARGSYSHLNRFRTTLDTELSNTEIRKLSITGYQGEASLANVHVSGPFDASTLKSDLLVTLENVDRHLLNLSGMDFGRSRFDGVLQLAVGEMARSITAKLDISGKDVSVTVGTNATPEIQLSVKLDSTADLTASTMDLTALNLTVRNSEKVIADLNTDQPMQLNWSEMPPQAKNLSVSLDLNDFDLEPWKALAGGMVDACRVDAKLKATQTNDTVELGLNARISNLSTALSPIDLSSKSWALDTSASFNAGKDLDIQTLNLVMSQGETDLVRVASSGRLDPMKFDGLLNVELISSLPNLLSLFPIEGITSTSGEAKLTSEIGISLAQSFSITNHLEVNQLQTSAMGIELTGYSLESKNRIRLDLSDQGRVEIADTTVRMKNGENTALEGVVQASLNLANGALNSRLQVMECNEILLRALLKPYLTDGELEKGRIQFDLTADMPSPGITDVAGRFSAQDIAFKSAKTQDEPKGLYDMKAEWEVGLRETMVHIKKGLIDLAPTYRATNNLSISGSIPLVASMREDSVLTIQSAGLDITPWYDRIFGQPASQTTPETDKPTDPENPEPAKEPDPIQLPVDRFVANLDIARFYLRDIAVRDWKTRMEIRGNTIKVDPLSLNLNNAPVAVNLDLNLNEPGWLYDSKIKADGIPLAPFANSFAPLLKDRMNGQIHMDSSIKGKGITGVNLKNHLQGSSSLTLTNASVTLVGPVARNIILPIATLLRTPSLLKPPMHYANSRIDFGAGNFDIKELLVQSPAFEASVAGQVAIADDVMQSNLDLPLRFAVRKTFLESQPAEGESIPYTDLPNFVTLEGSLGDIKVKTDKLAISGLVLQSTLDFTGKTGMKVGETAVDAIKGIGGLLNEMQPFKKKDQEAGGETKPENENTEGNPLNNLFKKLPIKKD